MYVCITQFLNMYIYTCMYLWTWKFLWDFVTLLKVQASNLDTRNNDFPLTYEVISCAVVLTSESLSRACVVLPYVQLRECIIHWHASKILDRLAYLMLALVWVVAFCDRALRLRLAWMFKMIVKHGLEICNNFYHWDIDAWNVKLLLTPYIWNACFNTILFTHNIFIYRIFIIIIQ